jgi:predicted NAD-dependent protein-ADP-ribosyltransferase YbiA (DUF1768 family)
MSNVINISNPHSQYGSLSNNFNGKELRLGLPIFAWKNVTKSIYGRLLGRHQGIINKAKDKEVMEIYQTYKNEEDKNIMGEAIRAALEAKIQPNSQLAKELISTGDRPIVYKSPNTFLGEDNQVGENNYGKSLEQIRYWLKTKQDEDKVRAKEDKIQQSIYDTFLAYKSLEKMILDGQSISEYTNKSSKEIIDMIGREKVERDNPSKRIVMQLADKGVIEQILKLSYNQNNIVYELNKKYLQTLRLNRRKKRNEIVFDMYADYLLEKFYPDLLPKDYEKAKRQEFGTLTWFQKNELEEKLYDQYIEGLLSERLSQAIDQRLSTFEMPTQEEVDQAKIMEITYNQIDEQEEEDMYKQSSGDTIYVYPIDNESVPEEYKPFVKFSPLSFGLFSVNNFIFPNISLYILFRLTTDIPNEKSSGFFMGDIDNIYRSFLRTNNNPKTQIDFITLETAERQYDKLKQESFKFYSQKYAKEAIELKLTDRSIQDVLLITGNAKLVYNDPNPNLGLSQNFKRGNNFVGEYLMFLRDIIREQRKDEKLPDLTNEDISLIITSKDVFLNYWFRMRIIDMCNTVIMTKNFLYKQFGLVSELTPKLVQTCLDSIYIPCSHITQQINLVSIPYDTFFENTVRKCRGFKTAST